ncbi:unnamed protein product [Closterium sp. Yama58-4]|nr:unnamed protein product [Closterium sp. Yama58-4]
MPRFHCLHPKQPLAPHCAATRYHSPLARSPRPPRALSMQRTAPWAPCVRLLSLGAASGGTKPKSTESGGAAPEGTETAGARSPWSGRLRPRAPLSPQQLHEWYTRRQGRAAGGGGSTVVAGAGRGTGSLSTGGAGVAAPEGALTGGTGAAGAGGAASGGAAAGDTGTGGAGSGGAAAGDTETGDLGTGGAGSGGAATGGASPGGAGAGGAGAAGGAEAPGGARAAGGVGATGGARATGGTGAAGGAGAAGGTGAASVGGTTEPRLLAPSCLLLLLTLSSLVVVLRVVSLRRVLSRLFVLVFLCRLLLRLLCLTFRTLSLFRAAHPTVTRLLATVVTDPSSDSAAASALVAELVDFAAAYRLDYAASLVAESECVCPPSVGGECDLGTDVLEDRHEDLECLAAAAPHLVAMLLAPEGDPDAPDIPTPRSYAEAIAGEYSSQWQTAMDAEMASWKSTVTYVDEVPPPGANIVDGMWIFRVKRPSGSPPVFKARYVARGFSQREGVDFFQTFSPTPKMTTLRVLLHVAAQRDYELHSLDFSTTFLQGSLHEEIWLRRPPGFTGSFPPGTQWSLQRPVYGLRQAPREWHDTLRMTLAALGFAPSTADPSLFLRTDTSLLPFYILVYVDDLVFATADTEALALVKSELQKRHTCAVTLACRSPGTEHAAPSH